MSDLLDEMQSPTTEEEWEQLLAQCNAEAKTGSNTAVLSLGDMLGAYKPMSVILGRACPLKFYVKKPKLRQRLEFMEDANSFTGTTEKEQVEFLCQMIAHCVYVRNGREFAQATADDLLDELDDLMEAQKLATEVLGMSFEEKGGTPGLETSPTTTENSSPALPNDTDSGQTK